MRFHLRKFLFLFIAYSYFRYHDLYHLNLTSGVKELFLLNTEGFSYFVFDHKLRLRLAAREAEDAGTNYYRPILDPIHGNITDFELYRYVRFENDYTTGPAGRKQIVGCDCKGIGLCTVLCSDTVKSGR